LSYTTILVEDKGPLRIVRMNRPEQRNAMTPEMQDELISALEDAAKSDCRVLVLGGSGAAFCAGLDLKVLDRMMNETTGAYRADAERAARLFRTLYELPIPTIAAVHGAAIGGGAGLAIICDFVVAARTARFGFTEARLGFVPALVSVFLLLQLGDTKRARDLLLTARIFGADEALAIGLISAVVPPGESLAHRVEELAETLLTNSPQSLAATKQLLAAQNKTHIDAAIRLAIETNARARETADFREGIAAFVEKRQAVWTKSAAAR
jgi:methylglutaconyl-CoA hydratase